MKIYTKTGDDGSTGLLGGKRVSKSDPRIECTGTIDELNAAIGLAVIAAPDEVKRRLRRVQNELFVIGSHLAQPGSAQSLPALGDSLVTSLEGDIDDAELQLPPLRNFILPGGSESAARLHLARTICRRAERRLVALAAEHAVEAVILAYMNRLSDWLFVQARLTNKLMGTQDVLWEK